MKQFASFAYFIAYTVAIVYTIETSDKREKKSEEEIKCEPGSFFIHLFDNPITLELAESLYNF